MVTQKNMVIDMAIVLLLKLILIVFIVIDVKTKVLLLIETHIIIDLKQYV